MAQEVNLFTDMRIAVVYGKRDALKELIQQAFKEGRPPMSMVEALVPAMHEVGDKYERGEFYLPQMMVAARAMSEGLALLKPHLTASQTKPKGKAVIGTVKGDYHDIGKNIVKMVLEAGQFEVVDLGVDVPPERFVAAVKEEKPRFVLMSALLTLTMANIEKTIRALSEAGLREEVKVGVGGAPLSQSYAERIGAHFYGKDAPEALRKCEQLV